MYNIDISQFSTSARWASKRREQRKSEIKQNQNLFLIQSWLPAVPIVDCCKWADQNSSQVRHWIWKLALAAESYHYFVFLLLLFVARANAMANISDVCLLTGECMPATHVASLIDRWIQMKNKHRTPDGKNISNAAVLNNFLINMSHIYVLFSISSFFSLYHF